MNSFLFFLIAIWLIYISDRTELISLDVQQSDAVIYILFFRFFSTIGY